METLPNGVLPAGHELLHYLLTVKMLNTGCHKNSDRKVALDVVLQWIFRNIYPKDFRTVENNLMSMLHEYKSLKKRASSKKSDEYWVRYNKFVKQQQNLFTNTGEDVCCIMFTAFVHSFANQQ